MTPMTPSRRGFRCGQITEIPPILLMLLYMFTNNQTAVWGIKLTGNMSIKCLEEKMLFIIPSSLSTQGDLKCICNEKIIIALLNINIDVKNVLKSLSTIQSETENRIYFIP